MTRTNCSNYTNDQFQSQLHKCIKTARGQYILFKYGNSNFNKQNYNTKKIQDNSKKKEKKINQNHKVSSENKKKTQQKDMSIFLKMGAFQ